MKEPLKSEVEAEVLCKSKTNMKWLILALASLALVNMINLYIKF
jgi:hypothetical protein